jgi:hypothetical protein
LPAESGTAGNVENTLHALDVLSGAERERRWRCLARETAEQFGVVSDARAAALKFGGAPVEPDQSTAVVTGIRRNRKKIDELGGRGEFTNGRIDSGGASKALIVSLSSIAALNPRRGCLDAI